MGFIGEKGGYFDGVELELKMEFELVIIHTFTCLPRANDSCDGFSG